MTSAFLTLTIGQGHIISQGQRSQTWRCLRFLNASFCLFYFLIFMIQCCHLTAKPNCQFSSFCFRAFDQNGDGFISIAELRQAMSKMGKSNFTSNKHTCLYRSLRPFELISQKLSTDFDETWQLDLKLGLINCVSILQKNLSFGGRLICILENISKKYKGR